MIPTRSLSLATLALTAAAFGCGSSTDETGTDGDPTGMMDPTGSGDPTGMMDPIGPDGLAAGTNGTMPCDPAIETGFAGDELCILPPDPGTGLFMHAGPEDYDDPDEVAPFLLEAGGEATEYFALTTDNTEPLYFYKQHYRMRPGSHHLIISQWNGPLERGWYAERSDMPGERLITIGGTQRSSMDYPPGGIPPEDELFFRPVNPETGMAFQLHYVNPNSEPILREAWVNFMENPKAFPNGIILGAPFLMATDFAIPPGAVQNLNHTAVHDPDPPDEARIVSIFGHRHANTTRFTVWAHLAGERTLVYEDYDWAEPAELFYNTITENPAPDPATFSPGGYSGILTLQPGDAIEWECEVHNETEYTLVEGDQVYTGEMCNLFGTMTAPAGAYPIWVERVPSVCSGTGCP